MADLKIEKFDRVATVIGTAERHRVLLVDDAPEAEVPAVLPLQAAGSMAAGWTGLSTSTPISMSSGMMA